MTEQKDNGNDARIRIRAQGVRPSILDTSTRDILNTANDLVLRFADPFRCRPASRSFPSTPFRRLREEETASTRVRTTSVFATLSLRPRRTVDALIKLDLARRRRRRNQALAHTESLASPSGTEITGSTPMRSVVSAPKVGITRGLTETGEHIPVTG